MSEHDKEQLLAECVEDYHRARARREIVDPDSYRDRLGEHHREFLDILEAEEALDRAVRLGKDEPFPRPFGDYTLVRELGRGAAGVVYEAVHRPLGRVVALKILRTGFDTEPIALERFRLEAQACAQIRHENVVEIYEAGESEGRPYYAMPMLTGESLASLIKNDRAPEPRELCRNLVGIADALAVMHRAGIVHRDIKPSNIMVEPDGRMILADFGLARSELAQTLTQTGQALGTPLYMSPEQLLGERSEIDGRTDIYGLGVTMYEALAGRTPFRADNFTTLMRLIVTERPPTLAEVAPDVPKDCANIAMKAMEPGPSDRYANAEAMREDLENYAENRPVSGRPVSPARAFVRRRGRHLAAAAVVLVAALIGLIWHQTRPVPPALLTVACFPPAEVLVNGAPAGHTPLEIELAAGEHELILRHKGFRDRPHRITLEPGETRNLETVIVAEDPEDPEVLRELGAQLQLAWGELEVAPGKAARERSKNRPAVHVLYPRDDVRLEDLAHARVDVVDVAHEPSGPIRFQRGEEVLHEVPWDPDAIVNEIAIPETVRAKLRPGDEVTWGYYPEGEPAVVTTFRVLDEERSRALRLLLGKLEKRLEGQPATIVNHLRAQVFLKHELNSAAILEADRVVKVNEESDHALSVKTEALKRLGLDHTMMGRVVREKLVKVREERARQLAGERK